MVKLYQSLLLLISGATQKELALGTRSISRNTVKRILKEHGLEPGPKRGLGTWDEFLKRHGKTLWECDFFSSPATGRLAEVVDRAHSWAAPT